MKLVFFVIAAIDVQPEEKKLDNNGRQRMYLKLHSMEDFAE